jgi:hypothetical protein
MLLVRQICRVSGPELSSYSLESCFRFGSPLRFPETSKLHTRKLTTISTVLNAFLISAAPHLTSRTELVQSSPGRQTSVAVHIFRFKSLRLCGPQFGNFPPQFFVVFLRCDKRATIVTCDPTKSNHLLLHPLPPFFSLTAHDQYCQTGSKSIASRPSFCPA